jgi:hypothetical protein
MDEVRHREIACGKPLRDMGQMLVDAREVTRIGHVFHIDLDGAAIRMQSKVMDRLVLIEPHRLRATCVHVLVSVLARGQKEG